ncbi:peptidoglycan recognition protein family protein [Streptomyces sp. NPDC002755]|uniref:peptidoglycan recognition protein family protein n=1 Tax=Streptomyces sp. NPDC002884 TaxID=3154544 RepID=UPI00331AA9AF
MVNNGNFPRRPYVERGVPASRRRFLAVLGVASAGLPLLGACETSTRTAAGPPGGGTLPKVLASRVPSPGRTVKRTSFPLTAVSLTWTGPPRGVRLRLIDHSGKPGVWQDVTAGCPCGKDGNIVHTKAAAPLNRALVPAHRSYGYQLDVDPGVKVTEAVAIDSSSLGQEQRSAPSGTPPKSTGIPVDPATAFPPTDLIYRVDWGADETKRFTADGQESSPTRFSRAQNITVHHTATLLDDPDPAATVRAIYEQHAVSNDWGDIGYNFLIDYQGRIYEGRYSGMDGVPAHNERDEVVTAFHTFGFNPGNIGIALLGDFSKEKPSARMHDSLVRLTASLAVLHRLDPLGDITYRSITTGKSTNGRALGGHRDWTSTECPGSNVYLDLPAVRQQAARLTR